MAKNHNLAFDYSEYDRAEEQQERVIRHKANPNGAENKRPSAVSIFMAVVVAVLFAAMVFGRVEVSGLYTQRAELQSELTQLQSENVSLESELAKKTNMSAVEDYAENTLGLKKLDKSQIEYVEVNTDTVAEIVSEEDTSVFLKIKQWFVSVKEYLGL
jgi:cell division protein FtsL